MITNRKTHKRGWWAKCHPPPIPIVEYMCKKYNFKYILEVTV